MVVYELVSGGSGGADIGWGHYSMNLLSPIWPAHSGLFGPNRPDMDATGGQYEGFNYLGAGGWLHQPGLSMLTGGLVTLVGLGMAFLYARPAKSEPDDAIIAPESFAD